MRVLVDTSVWVDHLRQGNDRLARLLDRGEVSCHRFVIGELACGNLGNRKEILALLNALPETPLAAHEEALAVVDAWNLGGSDLGWIDIHLLASARLADCRLWTVDRALGAAALELGCG
jgi:predicted nucleic acid-binding protein